jgi:hypothetical protein
MKFFFNSLKEAWTEKEDNIVRELVQKHGPQKWTFIAEHLPGRIGKQCRERWHNHLNPRIKKDPWSYEEEWLLFLVLFSLFRFSFNLIYQNFEIYLTQNENF